MATGEELDVVKLSLCFFPVPDTQEAERRRELLKSWFDRYTSPKPAVVFSADRPDGFKVGDTDVYWGELALHWKRGRDAVFTFLGG